MTQNVHQVSAEYIYQSQRVNVHQVAVEYITSAVQLTGLAQISAANINQTLGKAANTLFSINATDNRALAVRVTANTTIRFSDFVGKTFEYVVTISSNTTNVNVQNLFVANVWTSNVRKRVVVANGVVIGAIGNNYSMRTGNGFSGSLLIQNYGSIQGRGGTLASPTGGPAFFADPGITVSLENYGEINSGGGAGGNGGIGQSRTISTVVREPTTAPQAYYQYSSSSPRSTV